MLSPKCSELAMGPWVLPVLSTRRAFLAEDTAFMFIDPRPVGYS